MSFEENLDVFFNTDEFADEITVVETGRKFAAIFDEQFFDPETGEAYLEGSKPYLTCATDSIAGDLAKKKLVDVKNTITGDTRRFSVLQIQREGTGTAIILLSQIVS